MEIDSLGRSGKFEELREFLQSAGYTEEFLCGRFGLKRAEQFELAVSFAATLAEDLFRVGRLQLAALDDELAQPIRRVANLEAFLNRLAITERQPAPPSNEGVSAPAPEGEVPVRRRVITFAPDGPRGVAAYVDGQKTATA